jgi:hypothetical protein
LEQEEAERAAAEEFALRADFDEMMSKNLMGDGGETERFILRYGALNQTPNHFAIG